MLKIFFWLALPARGILKHSTVWLDEATSPKSTFASMKNSPQKFGKAFENHKWVCRIFNKKCIRQTHYNEKKLFIEHIGQSVNSYQPSTHAMIPYQVNTKGGSITVPLTSCLTGLESAVWPLTIFVFIFKTV